MTTTEFSEWTMQLREDQYAWCYAKAEEQVRNAADRRARRGFVVDHNAFPPEKEIAKKTMGWMGQYAAAEMLRIGLFEHWRDRQRGDLHHGIEVRSTDHPRPILIFNDRDVVGRAFVLVHIRGMVAECLGWHRFDESAKAKSEHRVKQNHNGTTQEIWMMKTIHLQPMSTMRQRLDQLQSGGDA